MGVFDKSFSIIFDMDKKEVTKTDNNTLNQVVTGCQDYNPELWEKIMYMSNVVRNSAKQMGIDEIETPTMEYKSLLLNKYGGVYSDSTVFNKIPLDDWIYNTMDNSNIFL